MKARADPTHVGFTVSSWSPWAGDAESTKELLAEHQEDWTTFQAILALRLVVLVCTLVAIGILSQVAAGTGNLRPVVILVLTDLGMTLPFYLLGVRYQSHLRQLNLGIICFEIGAVTVGEYLIGPQTAVYGLPLYGFLIVTAAAVHSAQGARAVALLSISAHALTVSATASGLIPQMPDLFHGSNVEIWPWLTVLLNTTNSVTFAAISGSLAGSLRNALVQSKLFERRLEALNRDLENRVSEAVRELHTANQTLAAKNEELTHSGEQVELFARAVAHDLRNPITSASEALRLYEDRDAESQERLVGMARETLLRADRMLMGLRELMRTVGTLPEPEVVRVNAILKEVVRDLSLARGGLDPPVEIVGELGDVLARSVQLTHVLRNLLSNALEHNRDQCDLQIEVGREMDAMGEVTTFFVRDNGKGVPEELRERIFVPFRRGPGSPESGLGLGLALVDAIITQAGGNVWVDDAPGGGAAFYFTLPVSPREVADGF